VLIRNLIHQIIRTLLLRITSSRYSPDYPYPCSSDYPYPYSSDYPYPYSSDHPYPYSSDYPYRYSSDYPYPYSTDHPYPYSPEYPYRYARLGDIVVALATFQLPTFWLKFAADAKRLVFSYGRGLLSVPLFFGLSLPLFSGLPAPLFLRIIRTVLPGRLLTQ
jgi:hypothetical protein